MSLFNIFASKSGWFRRELGDLLALKGQLRNRRAVPGTWPEMAKKRQFVPAFAAFRAAKATNP
jgi:hypothetical protein